MRDARNKSASSKRVKMNNKPEDERDDAVNPAAPRSTRRQFLKGLTTGTVSYTHLTLPTIYSV